MASPSTLVAELGEPIFASCAIAIELTNAVGETSKKEIVKAIERHGGRVAKEMSEVGVTHVVREESSAKASALAKERGVVAASAEWVFACVDAKAVLDVKSNVVYEPPRSVLGVKGFEDCVACATGYGGRARKDVETMVKILGGKYQKTFDRGVTHLVAYEFNGAKWERARGWTTSKIVNHRWLEDCVRRWERLDEAPYTIRSGKEEEELAAAVPDSEDEGAMVAKELSVIPDSMGTTTVTARPNTTSSADAQAFTSQLQVPPLSTSVKKKALETPNSTKGASADRSASKSANKSTSWRSPDWIEEEKRGARIAVSKRNRIDPKYKEALHGNSTQPEDVFHGLVGSPDDVEKAFGGRYAPENAWFRFFEDADAEPITDAPNLDEFCKLLASGRGKLEREDIETRMKRIRSGIIRFDVFDQGISESHEEEVLREGNGLCMRTLYSGTVILLADSLRNECDDIIKLVDNLEKQQSSGPIGAWIHALIRVETAKQQVHSDRVRPGGDALMTTFLTYMELAHGFQDADFSQLFNADGSFVRADKIITLPSRRPGNLAGVVLAPVDRTVRDVVAGYYELLAGPSEPDPTQRPASQRALSDHGDDDALAVIAMDAEEEEEREEEEEFRTAPEAKKSTEPQVANQAPKLNAPSVACASTSTAPEKAPAKKPKAPVKKPKAPVSAMTHKVPVPSGSKPKPLAIAPVASKVYIALSGFRSSDIRKYSAIVRRLGAVLRNGHDWEPSTTHVVFGSRGSRSIKFLAGAISGASLLDVSYLDACAAAGKILDAREEHFWRGGRGSEMGIIAIDSAKHWSSMEPHSAFCGLSVALLPFEPNAKGDRAMLDVVLRAGGASVSSVSSKGDVCLTQADIPDIVITDQVEASAPALVPRLAPLLDGRDVMVVTPEFFKSWISTPSANLDEYCLFGATTRRANDAIRRALSKRGECMDSERGMNTKAKPPMPAPRVLKPAASTPVLSQRQTRAKRAENAPLAHRVGKRRRVLQVRN